MNASTEPFVSRLIHVNMKRRLLAGLLSCMATVLRIFRQPTARNSNENTDTLTVMEPYNMGDIISLEPMARLLHKHRKRINVVAKPQWRALLPGQFITQWINSELPWSSYEGPKKYIPKNYLSRGFRNYVKRLHRLCKGTTGIDVRGDIRSVIMLYLAGCRKVLSLDSYAGTDTGILPTAAELVPTNHSLRQWEQNLEFCAHLGLPVLNDDRSAPDMRHLLPGAPATHKTTVGLIPVAPWPGREWRKSNWQELAASFISTGLTPLAFCGPGQKETARDIVGPSAELLEAANIGELAAHLSRCSVVVALDTGPMHLADALGIPVVGLFGPGKLPLWAPSGPLSIALHHQDAVASVPCHQVDDAIETGLKAMDLITAKEVLEAVALIRAKLPLTK